MNSLQKLKAVSIGVLVTQVYYYHEACNFDVLKVYLAFEPNLSINQSNNFFIFYFAYLSQKGDSVYSPSRIRKKGKKNRRTKT